MGPAFVLQDEASCGWMEVMVAQLWEWTKLDT